MMQHATCLLFEYKGNKPNARGLRAAAGNVLDRQILR